MRQRGAWIAAAALFVGSAGIAATPPAGTYEIDPPHTFIAFSAQHKIVGRVDGRFDKARGTVVVSSDLSKCGVDVTIGAESLSTQNSIRDEDVRGPDFFAPQSIPPSSITGAV